MAKVQDYGKDTDIDIDSVLYFKAEHKYVDVTYWVADEKRYATKTVQWALKAILAAHPEFEKVHRSILVRRDAIAAVHKVNLQASASKMHVVLSTEEAALTILPPISRRLVPRIRKIANANSTTA